MCTHVIHVYNPYIYAFVYNVFTLLKYNVKAYITFGECDDECNWSFCNALYYNVANSTSFHPRNVV